MRNIAVIGSRDFSNKKLVEEYLFSLTVDCGEVCFITGGARGVDTWVEEFYDKFKESLPVKLKVIRPISPFPKINYLYRNIEILTLADEVVAFWDNKSRGTKFVIDYAKARKKDLKVFGEDDVLI